MLGRCAGGGDGDAGVSDGSREHGAGVDVLLVVGRALPCSSSPLALQTTATKFLTPTRLPHSI
ncbi:unnamed protein product [Ectocarpus fasciculatus]